MDDMNLLSGIFSHVCGQQHCWILGEVSLPFCQRCTGLYVGAFCALILIAMYRPRPNAFLYWTHGAFMLAMFPFGFHLVEHGGTMRTFTGALFAFGLVYYLWLNPFSAWNLWKDVRRVRMSVYLFSIAAAVALLLISVHSGETLTARILAGLGAMGLGGLMLLTVLNLMLLPGILRTLLARSIPSPQ